MHKKEIILKLQKYIKGGRKEELVHFIKSQFSYNKLYNICLKTKLIQHDRTYSKQKLAQVLSNQFINTRSGFLQNILSFIFILFGSGLTYGFYENYKDNKHMNNPLFRKELYSKIIHHADFKKIKGTKQQKETFTKEWMTEMHDDIKLKMKVSLFMTILTGLVTGYSTLKTIKANTKHKKYFSLLTRKSSNGKRNFSNE